jgi:hypothetical protein
MTLIHALFVCVCVCVYIYIMNIYPDSLARICISCQQVWIYGQAHREAIELYLHPNNINREDRLY